MSMLKSGFTRLAVALMLIGIGSYVAYASSENLKHRERIQHFLRENPRAMIVDVLKTFDDVRGAESQQLNDAFATKAVLFGNPWPLSAVGRTAAAYQDGLLVHVGTLEEIRKNYAYGRWTSQVGRPLPMVKGEVAGWLCLPPSADDFLTAKASAPTVYDVTQHGLTLNTGRPSRSFRITAGDPATPVFYSDSQCIGQTPEGDFCIEIRLLGSVTRNDAGVFTFAFPTGSNPLVFEAQASECGEPGRLDPYLKPYVIALVVRPSGFPHEVIRAGVFCVGQATEIGVGQQIVDSPPEQRESGPSLWRYGHHPVEEKMLPKIPLIRCDVAHAGRLDAVEQLLPVERKLWESWQPGVVFLDAKPATGE